MRLYSIDGFESFIQPRNDGRRSGGVAFYVRSELEISVETEKRITTGNIIILEVSLKQPNKQTVKNHEKVQLMLIYRDCTSSKRIFVQELEEIINQHNKRNSVILGDINIDILNNSESSEYLNMLLDSGFISRQNLPSRDSSCLDHVMVRSQTLDTEANILGTQISDHQMITVEIKSSLGFEKRKRKSETTSFVDQNKLIELLRERYKTGKFTIDDRSDVDTDYNNLITLLQDCQEKSRKQIRKTNKLQRPRHEWTTKELLKLIHQKTEAYNLHRKNRENYELKKNFKDLSARVKRELRRAKVKYYSGMLDANRNKPKQFWKVVNGVRSTENKKDGMVYRK
jgi:hypothetical protein